MRRDLDETSDKVSLRHVQDDHEDEMRKGREYYVDVHVDNMAMAESALWLGADGISRPATRCGQSGLGHPVRVSR